MGSKGTPDKLVTSLDTPPNPEIEVLTLMAPGTPTPSGNFNNFNTATRISLVSPDENLDTANRSSWVWQYFKPVTVDGTPYNVYQAITHLPNPPLQVYIMLPSTPSSNLTQLMMSGINGSCGDLNTIENGDTATSSNNSTDKKRRKTSEVWDYFTQEGK
ncbi:hypothetical protein H4Q26_015561 [Puccinia striiformis f. sp. tritici PST-130]|nr:hypothetical protein H4Q26_015561 [Puccinia striiformis f. sp. tritici PST-130]